MIIFASKKDEVLKFICNCTFKEKDIPKDAGFLWNPKDKIWWTDSPENAYKLKYYWRSDVQKHYDSVLTAYKKNIDQSYAISSDAIIPRPKGLNYLSYQKAGIENITNKTNCLLADEMGLGKTIQALGVINKLKIQKVLIICPASLKLNWEIETKKWIVNKSSIKVITSKDYPDYQFNDNIVIINYDILSKFAKAIKIINWSLLVCDEAQALKSTSAMRTKIVLGGANKEKTVFYTPIHADRKLFLTGTPILNRPLELWPILKSCGIFKNFMYFTKKYCNGHQTEYGYNCSGASNLDELNNILRSKLMIRREKKDVLKELPAKRRQIIVLEPDAKTKQLLKIEIADYKACKKGLDGLTPVIANFAQISKLRIKTALKRITQITDYTDQAVEQQGHVVIFAHHKEVIRQICEELAARSIIFSKLTGDTKNEDRQQIVEDFQNGKIQVFVGSMKAAGIGLTLTKAAIVVFAELDWTPATIIQAEDRLHRIGQKNSIQSIFMVYDNSIDGMLAKKLIEKEKIINQIVK